MESERKNTLKITIENIETGEILQEVYGTSIFAGISGVRDASQAICINENATEYEVVRASEAAMKWCTRQKRQGKQKGE